MTTPIEIVKICQWCSKPVVIVFKTDQDIEGFWAWKEGGAFIQRAFAHWTPGQREELISGTHEKCFDEMFKEPDEDECAAYGHIWPAELGPGAECDVCGLEYKDWTKEETNA